MSHSSLPKEFLEPIINPDSEWRDLTDIEWRVLYAYLNTGYIWSDKQVETAADYIDGQYENNLRDYILESPETTKSPLTPDRYLYPRAQEIQRMAINQSMQHFTGIDKGFKEPPEDYKYPTLKEIFEADIPTTQEISPWLFADEFGYGRTSKNGAKSLKKLQRRQRKQAIAEKFASLKIAFGLIEN